MAAGRGRSAPGTGPVLDDGGLVLLLRFVVPLDELGGEGEVVLGGSGCWSTALDEGWHAHHVWLGCWPLAQDWAGEGEDGHSGHDGELGEHGCGPVVGWGRVIFFSFLLNTNSTVQDLSFSQGVKLYHTVLECRLGMMASVGSGFAPSFRSIYQRSRPGFLPPHRDRTQRTKGQWGARLSNSCKFAMARIRVGTFSESWTKDGNFLSGLVTKVKTKKILGKTALSASIGLGRQCFLL